MTWILVTHSSVLVVGVALGWTAARHQVAKRKTLTRDVGFLVRRPVELEPSEFGTFWSEQP